MMRSFSSSLVVFAHLSLALPASSLNTEKKLRRTQQQPEEVHPHQGCVYLLNETHTPQPPLVGAAYEALAQANPDYRVQNEVGATSATCINGQAGGYGCNSVDLLSLTDLDDLDAIDGLDATMANDIWGWTHANSGREFALVGLKEGTAFVEITDPYNPIYLGQLPTHTVNSSWRDIKTLGDYALIVSEANSHGMQIFDLTRLLTANAGTAFDEDEHYSQFGNAHNVFVNEDTNFAYAVGTSTCNGGLHIVDMDDPLNPTNAGCYSSDGYSHDVQCVVYNGPDTDYVGHEICFGSNEDTITIVDVTNKEDIVQLARESYSGDRYTHQGWLTEDHSYFIFNDELDEYYNNAPKTRTHVMDVSQLTNPQYKGYHNGRTPAIDHNLYVLGDLVYQANYRAGLNILKINDMDSASFTEEGYFDVYPSSDSAAFNGAWSTYPYFPSGNVVVSGIEQGLFVLKYNGAPTQPPVPAPTQSPVPAPTQSPVPAPTQSNCIDVSLEITTDNFPGETSWELRRGSTAIGEGSGYTARGSTITESLGCLPLNDVAYNTYEFEINDSYGDGICCGQGEGSYAIKFDGVTAKEGAQFGSTDTYSFPAEATPGPTPPAGHVPFVLRVRTDNWGGETSWVVTSTAGNGQSQSGSGYDSYTLYTETIDLVDQGCHTFTMSDSYGDGIIYGWYDISYDGEPIEGGNVEGNFGWSKEHRFGPDCEELASR